MPNRLPRAHVRPMVEDPVMAIAGLDAGKGFADLR